MKKTKILAILALAALIGLVALLPLGSIAFAHTTTPGATSGADEMMEQCHNMMGEGMMGVGSSGSNIGLRNTVTQQRIAGVIGVTLDEFQTRLSKGETIAQIAQSKNVNTNLIITSLLAPDSEILQVRVKYGYLTQEVANSILEQERLQADRVINTSLSGTTPTTTPGATRGSGRSSGGMMGGGMMGGGNTGGGMMGGNNTSGGMMGRGMMGGDNTNGSMMDFGGWGRGIMRGIMGW